MFLKSVRQLSTRSPTTGSSTLLDSTAAWQGLTIVHVFSSTQALFVEYTE